MAFNLQEHTVSSQSVNPPVIMIHGPRGYGKTSTACSFPKPFLVNLEKGTPDGINIPSTPPLNNYETVKDVINALYSQDHDYKTIIFDTVDVMGQMLYDFVCKEHGWENIEDAGYGKGYAYARKEWANFMRGVKLLNEHRGLCIVLLAHTDVGRFDDPQNAAYSQYKVRLSDKDAAIVGDLCDAVIFQNQLVKVEEKEIGGNKAKASDQIWAFCQPKPSFVAKNSLGMPDRFIVPIDDPYSAFAPYMRGMNAPQIVETAEEKEAA